MAHDAGGGRIDFPASMRYPMNDKIISSREDTQMKPIAHSIARIVCSSAAALLLCATMAAAQNYPREDAKLYELAQKEGTVVWYVSAPLEAATAIAGVFQKKYPGVRVKGLRIIETAKYRRFMQAP